MLNGLRSHSKLLFLLLLAQILFTVRRADAAAIFTHESDIPNLTAIKEQIIAYQASGAWEKSISAVADQAKLALKEQLHPGQKLAVVFDIDETALSKWQQLKAADFAFLPELFQKWYLTEAAIAAPPILDLYRFALNNGCAIFFITGRPELFRPATEANLKKVGYTTWTAVILRPNDDHNPSVIPYKSGARRSIIAQGYRIVVNIGDQYSDLDGGFADHAFKVPNPMYFIK